MAALALPILALLLSAGAAADSNDETVAFRTDMQGVVTFSSQETSDVAMVMLTSSVGITCYADWENPEDGQCNAVDFGNAGAPTSGSAIVLTEDRNATDRKAQRFTLGRLSDTMGVVCYTPFGDTATNARPVCRTLTVGGSLALTSGDELAFAPTATNVFTMSVAGLTSSKAVLCFQDTRVVTDSNRRDAVCQVLQATGGGELTTLDKTANLTYANAENLDNIQTISVSRISDSTSLVCYSDSTDLQIFCNQLALNEAGDDLVVGAPFTLGESKFWGNNFGSPALSVDALSESEAVACFCNGKSGPTCTPLALAGGANVSLAGEPFVVGTEACSEVSVTAMSDTAAIVCYLDGTGVNRIGKCSGLAYLNREFITGDAVDIPMADGADPAETFSFPVGSNENNPICRPDINPCEHWLAVSRRDDSNAAACYAAVGGSPTGRCVAINIPEPTTTVTTFTTTETSTTSEHTTTETSTSTATGTTTSITTGTETSSTTPHTTTGTTASETTVTIMEDSGAASWSGAQLMASLLACWALL